jgi:hypothetical protein
MPPGELERTGEILVEEGIIFQDELVRGLAEGGLKGSPLAALLEGSPHVRRADLAAFLATDYRIPTIDDLRRFPLSAETGKIVPEAVARKHEAVPIARVGEVLCVAKANYYNRAAIQELRKTTRLKIKVLQADEVQVRAALDVVYGNRRAELPAPSKRPGTSVLRAAPAPVPAPAPESVLEEVSPLEMISAGAATAAAPVAAAPIPARPAGDDILEVLEALRMPSAEFASAGRHPLVRLVLDFEEVFLSGRPIAPGRLS